MTADFQRFQVGLADTGIEFKTDADSLNQTTANVSKFTRELTGIISPGSEDELVQIVKAANHNQIPLYPVSTGKNWGFGSKLPVRNGAVLVDLSAMNRIIAVDSELGFAVVEPGVTQAQLAAHLKQLGAPYFLDVTGSGAQTSIIGNSLDRGIAYNSLRAYELSNLRVITGGGEVLQTGMGVTTDQKMAHLYQPGVGPGLEQLFFQSNFGIVTRATIRLKPLPSYWMDYRITFADEQLGQVMNAYRKLRHQGILSAITRTGDLARSFETLAPHLMSYYQSQGVSLTAEQLKAQFQDDAQWSTFGRITGPKALVRLKSQYLKKELAGLAKVEIFSEAKFAFAQRIARLFKLKKLSAVLTAGEPLRQLSMGQPTDAALEMVHWDNRQGATGTGEDKLDDAAKGFLLVVPMCPFTGREIRQMVELTREVCQRYEVDLGITLNTVSDQVVEGVISLKYSTPDIGHRCIEDLYGNLIALGFPPYRLNVSNMALVVDPEDPYWQKIKALKEIFDPNHILAPGRYCP